MTTFSDPIAILVFDIDGVLRDVGNSYRRALADTVEQFTQGGYRPTPEDIDALKEEGIWNNDWEGSQELIARYWVGQGQSRDQLAIPYEQVVTFFQSRYRGPQQGEHETWTGYITQEPLLVERAYFGQLTSRQIPWGFFSGATRGSARYVLERRLGLPSPTLIAMEDAPGKPDPSGLLTVVDQLTQHYHLSSQLPVLYAGDTVADMQTLRQAEAQNPQRPWLGVGVLPPHVVAKGGEYSQTYRETLGRAGATVVVDAITQLTADVIQALV